MKTRTLLETTSPAEIAAIIATVLEAIKGNKSAADAIDSIFDPIGVPDSTKLHIAVLVNVLMNYQENVDKKKVG